MLASVAPTGTAEACESGTALSCERGPPDGDAEGEGPAFADALFLHATNIGAAARANAANDVA